MKMPFQSRFFPSQRTTAPLNTAHSSQESMLVDKLEDMKPPAMHFTYPSGSKPLPRYTVRRGIGMGGFGEVYFAVSDAGKEVALKRIQRNLEVELRGVSHCLNLKHPHLVSLHDVCSDEKDQWWVVMEYIAGLNLRQVLDESPKGLSGMDANRWFMGIAAGVSHLHEAGLVHRDLKPGNIFNDMGIVKVGDYGLSKFISSSHRGGHTESVGTFHYMAPEIGRGQYGREIDIYALGILLYELLTGDVPFDGESPQEIIVKHLTAIPDLSAVGSPYRETIARCLEKDPQKRFQTVGEMVQSLGLNLPTNESLFPLAGIASDPSESVDSPASPSPVYVARLSDKASPATSPPMLGVVPEESSAQVETDEPLARAIRNSWGELRRWWRTLDRSPGARAIVFVGAIVVLAINTHWLLPLLSLIGIVYVPYYIVRNMVLHVRGQPSYAQAQRIAGTGEKARFVMTKTQWRHRVRSGLRAKPSVHRLAELNTSWVASIFTVGMLGLISGVVGLRSGPITAMTIAPYALVSIVVLLATLSLLGMGKLWERDEGENLTRRLVLSGVGGGVGAVAFAMTEFLMLPLDQGLVRDIGASTLPQTLYSEPGVPSATAMMAHFALLFSMLRWWKPVDPLRRTRLSLWAVAVAVVGEWAIHQVLPIPQPAGMLVVGGIAVATQMSAPWINPKAMPTEPDVSYQRGAV